MGLTDISHFDIDSEGKIFIANLKAEENYIFILNNDGSLISVFGSRGQGPGELQSPMELVISNQDMNPLNCRRVKQSFDFFVYNNET